MESERAYLAALERVVQSSEDGDELVLLGEGVELRFRATEPPPIESMTGAVWVLERVIDRDVVSDAAGERAALEMYTDGSVIGSTGCRTFHGHYQPRGADVLFTDFSLDGECPDELVSQDSHVVSVLGDGFRARIDGETLTLTARGQQGLLYRAEG
jgi:heat shock protein HslJ